MTMSRRRFLMLALAGGAGLVGCRPFGDASTAESATLMATPEITTAPTMADYFDEATGDPDAATLTALMALVDAYVGDHGATGHYRTYFVWRAQNLPGYQGVYTRFAAALNAAAQELAGVDYAEADAATRQGILHHTLELPTPESGLFNTLYTLPAPEAPFTLDQQIWWRFHDRVLGEIVHVFLNTNAWVMLGYDGWPGQPRGLERYTQPITAI